MTRAQSLRDVAESLAEFGEPYGLKRFLVAEIVLGYVRPELIVFIDTMGREWRRLYAEMGVDLDPLIDAMRDQRQLVQWSRLPLAKLNPVQRHYIEAFSAMGVADGLSIPIWGPNGYWAWVAAAGDRQLDLSHDDREALQLLAMLVLSKCRLLRYGHHVPGAHEHSISHREADILYWVLEGKTDDEIATIVGLGRATVKFHIHNAIIKLDATNRITAAVKALKSGLLLGPITRHAVIVPQDD
ncbi:helix-turn-helix transcriptional regulator [Caulobacter mirabilis]|uniref:helix-turn-helix transcriptional regulator n=1 Tax=Caulobacter mirabilis TaxID=69666 RepID=UPI0015592B5A|nr:LuxR family transcriptional regulator [Caulobacter mirabilis]